MKLEIGKEILLHELHGKSTVGSLLEVHHIVRIGSKEKISKIEEIKKSGNVVKRITTDLGSNLILSETANYEGAYDADGVIHITDSKIRWVKNKKLDTYNELISSVGLKEYSESVAKTWINKFRYIEEKRDSEGKVVTAGLRPPQLGGLYSIGAHWSMWHSTATIVMPTGTGKTETMLGATVAHNPGRILVVVPSDSLRTQTKDKFIRFGLLKRLGLINEGVEMPVVGVLKKRPKDASELQAFQNCNVVITTMSMVAQGSAEALGEQIAGYFSCLIVDEAHHIPAPSWESFKERFKNKKIIQFTATPFRRDGQPLDGKVIYSYPLKKAQEEGFFKPIKFNPIFELDKNQADEAIAEKAIQLLKTDLENGLDHLVMARAESVERAEEIYEIYKRIAAEYTPILIHSKLKKTDVSKLKDKLFVRGSRVLICVDMFGEGFDLPNLKIAAIHDTHKSLSIILQFTGRFTRSAENVGDANVVANIANVKVSSALEELYSEDADWNHLLSEYSSKAVKAHEELIEFLRDCERIGIDDEDEKKFSITPKMFNPVFSVAAYKCPDIQLKNFFTDLGGKGELYGAWHNSKRNVLFFLTKSEPRVDWVRSKRVKDRSWNIYLLHYIKEKKVLFIHSSDKSSTHQTLATAVSIGDAVPINGDRAFRCLDNISRLLFQQVGLTKPARRNLRYSMYSGSDVALALSSAQKENSTKSNVSGGGFENGAPVTIGCSAKGRVWSRHQGTINELLGWNEHICKKLTDDSIDTTKIIDNVMIPKEVAALPTSEILSMDWPTEIIKQSEEKLVFFDGEREVDISEMSIQVTGSNLSTNEIFFQISEIDKATDYIFTLPSSGGFKIQLKNGIDYRVKLGKFEHRLIDFLNECPPFILFVDGSEMDGNLLFSMENRKEVSFPNQDLESWDWSGTDIKKESQWRDGAIDSQSIQYKVVQKVVSQGYPIVFDDDDSGEAADVIGIKETENEILVSLFHCKYSDGENPGERVKDVVEVCAQAVRSSKWKWKFSALVSHMAKREAGKKAGRESRYINGDSKNLERLRKASKFKPISLETIIVQPGLQKSAITEDQAKVLNAGHSYLLETIGSGLKVVCSP